MDSFITHLQSQLASLDQAGLMKRERELCSAQGAVITVNQRPVLNFCANNYLGLANHPELIEAAISTLHTHGFGLSSVRFICGTQDLHHALEQQLSQWLGQEDAILYSSCFDANGGLFETLFTEEDAIISDALNHASIIDGIRLSKAQRFRYANNDMAALKDMLEASQGARYRVIATDGVFSMDGSIAKLADICELADKYDALVMVDDSHAVGFMGPDGSGTPALCGVKDRIDIVTGTLGKALGGASGGYTAAKKPVIDWLRQRSRPYLFSNSLAPAIVGATLAGLQLIQREPERRARLEECSRLFRVGMTELGFRLLPGEHAIVPVMLGEARLATQMADALLAEGVYVIGFSYPVVPEGQARIRVQLSAAHTPSEVNEAVAAFGRVGKQLGVIS